MYNPSLPPSAPPRSSKFSVKPLLAGSLICFLFFLLMDVKGIKTFLENPVAFARAPTAQSAINRLSANCGTEAVSRTQLSREQLLRILAVPEREAKARIREITTEPYCQLSSINIRAGVEAEREAYPLAFDPSTALVILYEDDEYAGYRFLF